MQQSDSLPLKGRVALVTGSSRGIGAAIALRLTRAGACVAINYVSDDERAERCAQHIMNDCGAGRSRDYLQGRCHRLRSGARHGIHCRHHIRRIGYSRQ